MLLEKLREYSDRLNLSPPMYQKTAIRWLIELDQDGRGAHMVPTIGADTQKRDRGKQYDAPHIGRSSRVVAKLLADTGEYVLGIARDKGKQKRVDERHTAFVQEVRACAAATSEPTVQAVLNFLEALDLSEFNLPEGFEPGDTVSFRVAGVMPIHIPSVQLYWASVAGKGDGGDTVAEMECLICGERRPAMERQQFKLKKIPGGQPSGTALISANSAAFCSYGLEASLIAPTCADCSERFSKAANALIEDQTTHLTIGSILYVFWTRDPVEFSPLSLLSNPTPEEVKALLASARMGRESASVVDLSPFYATAFSASGGRAVVRDWLESTVREAKQNLVRWFELQSIVGEWGETDAAAFPIQGFWIKERKRWVPGLAEALVPLIGSRRDIQRLNPNVPRALLHMALKGGPLPVYLLYEAVDRNRAERAITRARAALIKMVLLSQQATPKEDLMALDSENQDPAYLCGRLLAELEATQAVAIPNAGATITDRFFGTASSAPASVFGRLIRGSQAHLGKLRKERPGTYAALQRRLEDIQAGLTAFPKTLNLEEQGRFSLGYYHQRAANRAAALARKQSQNNAQQQVIEEQPNIQGDQQ